MKPGCNPGSCELKGSENLSLEVRRAVFKEFYNKDMPYPKKVRIDYEN